MFEFLIQPSSHPALFFAPVLLLIGICLVSRVYFVNPLSVNDPTSQYFYALKAFLSPSICPLIQSRDSLLGRNHYPLSFYWHCGRFAKFVLFLIRNNNYSASHVSPESQPYLNLSMRIALLSSQLLFPFLTQCLICLLFFDFTNPTFLSSLSCSLLILQINALFPTFQYPINTRSFGLFLFYSCFFVIVKLLGFNFLDVVNWSPDLSFTASSIPLLLGISLIIYFILQSSQQAAFVFVALIMGVSLVYVDLGITLWFVFAAVIFLMLQLNYTNLFPSIRAHFYHRIHMYDWAKKTYGAHRYLLKPITFDLFVSAFAGFKYLDRGFDESLSKYNWLYPILIYRIYPYAFISIFLLLNNNIIAFNNFIVVVCITAVVSALLTLSQTFQGYGPPGLPIVIFLPLVTMISLAILPVLFELPYGSILVFVISLELFIQLCFATYYLVRRFISCYDSARSLPMGIISSSFRFSNSNSFAKVLQAFEFLVTSHYATPSTIVSLGIHYQSMIEAAELYRQKLLDIEHPNIVPRSKSHPLIPAWRAYWKINLGKR